MNTTSYSLRWFAFVTLAVTQVFLPVSAQARTDNSASMPQSLYDALLKSTQKDAATFTPDGNGFSLQAGGLHAHLSSAGLGLTAQNGSGWNWSVVLDGFGRGANPSAVSAPSVDSADGLISYHYSGFSEWYRSVGIGLEQGFTIDQSPAGSGPLVLRLDLNTGLSGTLSGDGRSVAFSTGDGGQLRYSDLRVFDANGSALDAKLIYTPRQIVIKVDDRNAAYPLTVDPLIYLETKVLALDGATGDGFGYSVSVASDTAIIGAVFENSSRGVAYIFQRSGLVWNQVARLTASDAANNDFFGQSVAISGNTAVVGAPNKNSQDGEAYVFVEPANGWTDATQNAVLNGGLTPGSTFGFAVSISGETIAVGVPNESLARGGVDVFVKPGGGWSGSLFDTRELFASAGNAGDKLGYSVAVSEDTITAGAVGRSSTAGAVYVYLKSGGGWGSSSTTEAAVLTASDGTTNDSLGYSVALSGDTIVAGAPSHSGTQGKAYVFAKPGGGWTSSTETAGLTASDATSGSQLGSSVSISGGTVLAGAPFKNTARGKAYIFVKPGGGWSGNLNETAALTASDSAPADVFGGSVSLSGSTALVGAYGKNSNKGAAYFYFPQGQDLAAGASASSTTLLPYQSLTLTASVTNNGPTSASDVMVSAPLPTLSFTPGPAVPTFGSYDSSTGIWNVGTLAAGATAILTLSTSVPNAAGTHPAFTTTLLNWDTNLSNNTASVPLNIPALTFSPAPVSFANQLFYTTSPGQTVTVSSVSNDDVILGALSAPAGFALANDNCSNATLKPTWSCTFDLTFTPTAAVLYAGSVSIPSIVPADVAALSVGGKGVSGNQLLPNTSFETDVAPPAGVPDFWNMGGSWAPADGRDCTVRLSGACSLKLTGTGASKMLYVLVSASGSAGDDFLFWLSTKASGVPASPAAYRADLVLLSSGSPVGVKLVNFAPGTHGFSLGATTLTATAHYDTIAVVIEFNATSGTAWFDDANLRFAP